MQFSNPTSALSGLLCVLAPAVAVLAQGAADPVSSGVSEPAAAVRAGPDLSDCPTRISEVIENAQAGRAREQNRWRLYLDTIAFYRGMSACASLTTPGLRARLGEDLRVPADELLYPICRDATGKVADAALVAEAHGFLKVLNDAGVFDLLDLLSSGSRFVPDRTCDPMIAAMQAQFGHTRSLCRLLAVQMHLAAADGKPNVFLRALDHELNVSRACSFSGNLVGWLTGNAARAVGLREVRAAALAGKIPLLDCREALNMLDGIPTAGVETAIECERVFALEAVGAVYEKTRIEAAAAGMKGEAPEDGPMMPEKQAVEVVNRFFDAWRDSHSDDAVKQDAGLRTLEEIAARTDSREDPIQASPVPALLPPTKTFGTSARQIAAELQGTRLVLAIELFRMEKGAYPESLDALVPDYVRVVPKDPFAPLGNAIRYKRLGADSPRTYVLYSVGVDGEDNGGVQSPQGNVNALARPERSKGWDYILSGVE